jgi:phosphotransferase system HPr (HPr) family protein
MRGHNTHRLQILTQPAQCSIFCPDEVIASNVRDLNSCAQEASREVIIVNPRGLHARPTARFAKLALRFESNIMVEGRSRMDMLRRMSAEGMSADRIMDLLDQAYQSGAGEVLPADGKDLADLMCHFDRATPGSRFVIRARGPDAQQAVDQLAALVARGFDED